MKIIGMKTHGACEKLCNRMKVILEEFYNPETDAVALPRMTGPDKINVVT